ncbi:MAG: PTS system mannose/fructose/sorbose family transporter subunit IID [candidate division FCPU426 bacterium]
MSAPRRVTWRTLWAVIWRSLFLQTCWNFQGMQNVGFSFALVPLARALYPEPERRQALLARHLEFFNTHPYCASIILGVVCRLEEENDPEAARRIKGSMMGPLAALGDTVFWAMLKPSLALLAVCWIWAAGSGHPGLALLGPVLYLLLFNLAHLSLRAGGVLVGYARGLEIVKDLRRFNPQLIARRLGWMASVLLGATALLAWSQGAPAWELSYPAMAGLGLGATALAYMLLAIGLSATQLFYLLTGSAVLLAVLGWI